MNGPASRGTTSDPEARGAISPERGLAGGPVIAALAAAIGRAAGPEHLDGLIDLIGAMVPHDILTVTRYAVDERPSFVSHRHFSDAMVRRYLEIYYAFDPFYEYWRRHRRPGVVPLRRLADSRARRGRYFGEFLKQSVICDEVGVLLADREGCCLGIFLDRAERAFTAAEIAALEAAFPVLAALHHVRVAARGATPVVANARGIAPRDEAPLPAGLWGALSARERAVAALILAGHPNAGIARRLSIAAGTVKNHRHSIYAKLDVTTERELFLQFFAFMGVTSPA